MQGTKFSFSRQASSKSLCQASAHHSCFSLLQCWGNLESLFPVQCTIKISLHYLHGSPCQKCFTWIAISDLSFVNLGLFSLIKSKLFFSFSFFLICPSSMFPRTFPFGNVKLYRPVVLLCCSLQHFPLAGGVYTSLLSTVNFPLSKEFSDTLSC